MASKQKRAKSASKHDEGQQEMYECTNQEVLNAIFIGVSTSATNQPQNTAQPNQPGASPLLAGAIDLSEDSSAEEEEDLLRAHSRMMKQQEYEMMQRDGYVQQRDSSRLNQLDNSSRQNLLESGSMQNQQNSTGSPAKSHNLENSADGHMQQHPNQQLQHSNTYNNQNNNQMLGPLYGGNQDPNDSSKNAAMMMSDLKTSGMLGSPQMVGTYDLNFPMAGNMSNRQHRTGSKGKRGRPISAYPVPGSYPGGLSQISESVESTQASHLSKFTYSLARNNASRKQYVPHNIETFEKERLYSETISLKKQRNDVVQQNTLLKTNLKGAELDMRKKDQLIAQLTNDIKISANNQHSGYYPFNGGINQSSFMQMAPELQGASNQFSGSRHQKQIASQTKNQQLIKQNGEFRKRIKELKCDVALKQTEVQNLQRTLKFTKLKEFEVELHTYGQEIMRLKQMLMNEKLKPRVSPQQFAMLQNQLLAERQQMQQIAQLNEQQRQDIEKLTQAHAQSKLKLQKSKVKLKKLTSVKKRQEIKIKIMEQKIGDLPSRTSIQHHRGSKQLKSGGKATTNGFAQGGESETFEQLQTQLEINQILIDKLDAMGVDVRELIRTSQLSQDQNGPDTPYIRTVIFTFIGPEGLIEGGDNQQFEMPIDFNQVVTVEKIKEILKKELVMDVGIDLILREKSSGQVLTQIGEVHIAIDSGDGILVQFIEGGENAADQAAITSNNGNMAHIDEEEEKSEYSDEKFDDDDDEDEDNSGKQKQQKKQIATIPRITLEKASKGLKQIRLLFMIKKVPMSHMVKYLLQGEKVEKNDENGEEEIDTKTLAQIFERKFNFESRKATKMARFFIEGPPQAKDDSNVESKNHVADREILILRFKQFVSNYMLYNTLALDSMLSRIQGIMDGKKSDFIDDLNLEDEDSNGFLSFEHIQKVWKYSGHPSLDEELTEFLEFLALRCSSSLKKVNYEDFCEVFDDSFAIGDCKHDDSSPFDASNADPDDQDLDQLRQRRDTAANTAGNGELPEVDQNNQGGEDEEPEIDSDDLMLYIDEALQKIVSKLPDTKKKTTFNKKLLPLAQSIVDSQNNETVLILQPQVFIQFMVQSLGIQFSDKELYCLLHILVREQETGEQQIRDSLNQTQDGAGYILYRDVYTLVRNYLRKEKIMGQSISMGLDYQVLTKTTFDFLLRIKQILNKSDEPKDKAPSDKDQQVVEAKNFRTIFSKHIVSKRLNTDASVDLIEFDDFFDGLFMKFKIMCPPKDTLEQLKFLLCVQFGPNIKELSFFLVQKLERVLYDLDYVYVNLVKILRESNHERVQQDVLKRLKQRYDFVARGISKATAAAAPKKTSNPDENTKSNKVSKPRPMSSKPRKPTTVSSVEQNQAKREQSYMQQAENEIVNEEEYDDGIDQDENYGEDDVDDDVDDDIGDDDIDDDDVKAAYDRQKTKDIGFELPNDDDDSDDDADEDDGIEDDYQDDDQEEEDVSEDDEAQFVVGKGKNQQQMGSDKSDDIDDEYSDDNDNDDDQEGEGDNPPIQETKTLKQIQEGPGKNNMIQDDDGIVDDIDDDGFEEDEILDDYD